MVHGRRVRDNRQKLKREVQNGQKENLHTEDRQAVKQVA